MSNIIIVPDGLGCYDVNQDGKRIASFTTVARAEKFIDNKRRNKNDEFTNTPAA